jgi:Tol biopolymer transport system component
MTPQLRTNLLVAAIVIVLAACVAGPPPPREYKPVWSPDGQRIAYVCFQDGPIIRYESGSTQFSDRAAEICVMNSDGTGRRRLTRNQVEEREPTWSPAGKLVAFASVAGLYVVDPQGGEPQLLFEGDLVSDLNWSPDGLRIAFVACRRGGGSDIYVADRDGRSFAKLDNPTGATLEYPRWSPDGSQLAYTSASDPDCSSSPILSGAERSLMIASIGDTFPTRKVADGLVDVRQVMWIDQGTLAYSVRSSNGFTLYFINLISGSHTKATPEEATTAALYAWAPDGSSLAYTVPGDYLYVRNRSSGQTIRVLGPIGTITDEIVWSPDSQRLLLMSYERVPGMSDPTYTEAIWIVERGGAFSKRLTHLPGDSD